MDGTKEWYKSKTIWASLVTVVIGVLASLGVGDFEGEKDAIVETIMQIVTLVCGIVALVGRVTAKHKLTGPSGGTSLLILLVIATVAFCVAGCSQVQLSAPYAQQLEMSAANVNELNRRCQAGDPNACQQGLAEASQTLNLLVDGMHGKGGD